MAGFIERNKKKGLLALLLYIARRGKAATGFMMILVVTGLILLLGTPEAVRQRVPWAPRGLLTRGMDTSNSGLGADEEDVAMRLSEDKGEGMSALAKRMLNSISGPRGPVVDMVAGKNADLQEPSAQKQVGDKLSKHGRGIRGIVRKEDSSRGSASIALSPQELQRGLANGPDRITQPQSSMRQNAPGGAPMGGGSSSDFSGQAQMGRQSDSGTPGTPSEGGSPPEGGGPPTDTTSLIIGGGEPVSDARAGDANFDLMEGTYGGGGGGGVGGGQYEGEKFKCNASGRKGCLEEFKAQKEADKKGGDVTLPYMANSDAARLQLAEVKAYSFAAAGGKGDGEYGVSVQAMVVKAGKWTTQDQEGQCSSSTCPKEYASVVADAPFQRNLPRGGLVHVDAEGVPLGDMNADKVDDYAQRVAEMDALAKRCEEKAIKYGKGHENDNRAMDEFLKASNDYLTAIKNRGSFAGNRPPSPIMNGTADYSDLPKECGTSNPNATEDSEWTADKSKNWTTLKELKDAEDAATTACLNSPHTHPPPCKDCQPIRHPNCRCSSYDAQTKLWTKEEIAKARNIKANADHQFCIDQNKILNPACKKVMEQIKNKREDKECESAGSEFSIYENETQDVKTADGTNLGRLDCKNLIWRSETGGLIDDIVKTDNLGRDKCFKVSGLTQDCK